LFEPSGAEESLTRGPADAGTETSLQTEGTEQAENKKAEVTARLEEDPATEASPGKAHQIDLAKIKDRSECEAFLDGIYGAGLRDNASRFQSCSERGGRTVSYQQPGCKDPIWSRMEGPELCRPLVEYACEVFRRKSDFLAQCDQQLAKR
jgi:hypothetical protein